MLLKSLLPVTPCCPLVRPSKKKSPPPSSLLFIPNGLECPRIGLSNRRCGYVSFAVRAGGKSSLDADYFSLDVPVSDPFHPDAIRACIIFNIEVIRPVTSNDLAGYVATRERMPVSPRLSHASVTREAVDRIP